MLNTGEVLRMLKVFWVLTPPQKKRGGGGAKTQKTLNIFNIFNISPVLSIFL